MSICVWTIALHKGLQHGSALYMYCALYMGQCRQMGLCMDLGNLLTMQAMRWRRC